MPRNSLALAARLRAGGVPVEVRAYPGVGHVELLLALTRLFRRRAPVLEDAVRFVLDRAPPLDDGRLATEAAAAGPGSHAQPKPIPAR